MVYTEIYNKIIEVLETVDGIKQIKDSPLEEGEKLTGYPAVIVYPEGNTNIFDTSATDFREYKFKMFVIVAIQGTTINNVFRNVLSNMNDKILEAFSQNWDFNAIDGHRV
jgi:hypothetical protein